MDILILTGAGAAAGGLVAGALVAGWAVTRKYSRKLDEVRAEAVRLNALAEEKLAGDDPNLDDLLRGLKAAMTDAYGALDAMKLQASITRRKSQGAREVIALSHSLLRMIDGDAEPETRVIETRRAPQLTAAAATQPAANPVRQAPAPAPANKTNKIVLR